MEKSKLNKTKYYKGPSSAEDEPMNETMVKLILQSAGFSSVEEVRKIAKEENEKATKAMFEKPVDFDKPDWIKTPETVK